MSNIKIPKPIPRHFYDSRQPYIIPESKIFMCKIYLRALNKNEVWQHYLKEKMIV